MVYKMKLNIKYYCTNCSLEIVKSDNIAPMAIEAPLVFHSCVNTNGKFLQMRHEVIIENA